MQHLRLREQTGCQLWRPLRELLGSMRIAQQLVLRSQSLHVPLQARILDCRIPRPELFPRDKRHRRATVPRSFPEDREDPHRVLVRLPEVVGRAGLRHVSGPKSVGLAKCPFENHLAILVGGVPVVPDEVIRCLAAASPSLSLFTPDFASTLRRLPESDFSRLPPLLEGASLPENEEDVVLELLDPEKELYHGVCRHV